jgi:hypothetical protein
MMNSIRLIFLVYIILGVFGNLSARDITVHNSTELLNALQKAPDTDTFLLAPGEYTGGIYVRDISGRKDAPVTIRGTDPNNPPVFSKGGSQAIQMADCNYITFAYIRVTGYPGNGINIDDGGSFETPSHHIVCNASVGIGHFLNLS